MKTFYFLICLIFMGTLLNAQQFSTQFYFTDTLGNQDTVTVGFNPGATRGVDIAFGEVDMQDVPFSNGLEVRTAQFSENALGCEPNNGPFSNNIDNGGLMIKNGEADIVGGCLLYTSPSPRDLSTSRMPSSA